MFKDRILELPDRDYRDLPVASYSLLKSLDDEGPKAISNPKIAHGEALDFGQLVDIIITSPERRDEIFYYRSIEKPTASLLALADSIILDAIVNDDSFESITDATIDMRIKELGLWSTMKNAEKIKEKYDNDLFWNYIKCSLESKGKIILTQEVLEAAEHCADVLLNHEFTKDYFIEKEGVEILKQPSILYKFKGIKAKARIDLLIVDHNTKMIHVFDIKTGSELPSKFEISFYKYKYYLQVISYLLAVQSIVETSEEFNDYKIDTFKFLYISKKLPDVPVIYEVPERLLNSFMDGWLSSTGDFVAGYDELIKNYQYVVETGNYNCERKVMENNGKLKISLW